MNLRNVKPVYWIILIVICALMVKLFMGPSGIDKQIVKQNAIVQDFTERVNYASGDIAMRKSEYERLNTLKGGATKVLELLKKSRDSSIRVDNLSLEKQFLFTGSIY